MSCTPGLPESKSLAKRILRFAVACRTHKRLAQTTVRLGEHPIAVRVMCSQ